MSISSALLIISGLSAFAYMVLSNISVQLANKERRVRMAERVRGHERGES